jgi:putative transposase
MRLVKGRASHEIRKEFPELLKLPTLWTPSYFVSTAGNVCTETVQRYIEQQKS